ncbi:conjugative transposon protein TraN [Alistipes ihumii]
MKRLLFVVALTVLFFVGVQAQDTVRTFSQRQVVEPYRVEVAFNKTLHILFPSEVVYVDLGSLDLIADKANGAQNVVRIKAAKQDFTEETNFSVITADGCFYSFTAVYSENPSQLNIEMEDWLHKDPYSDFANRQMYIRLDELSGETPLTVNRIMYTILRRNVRDIKSVGSKRFGIEVLLRGVYVHGDLFYLHVSMRNRSKVAFDIDYIRFKICDKKTARRTAVQETFVNPVRVFDEIMRVDAEAMIRNVFVFRKFTIPDDKVLVMEVYERNGGRHQRFEIENSRLVGAREMDELKIE